jgi:ornithine carbamoyltransferase
MTNNNIFKLSNQSFLTGEELTIFELQQLLDFAEILRQERQQNIYRNNLRHKHLALIFDKPSLRTRFSFTVAMQELGGQVIESASSSRKTEEPEDSMRVLQGYCHAVMIRTFDETIISSMIKVATIPVINGLSDRHHPCQILADLLTLKQRFSALKGLTLAYLGDGNNILHSLLLLAPQLGVNIHYCCPANYGPDAVILKRANSKIKNSNTTIQAYTVPQQAVKNAQAVYTDVWTSMGCAEKKLDCFVGYQVNEKLMQYADKDAVFMHCMPMVRGEEVSKTLPDKACSVIFQQSENRLHVQKALLFGLLQ